jgi:hypothetical protein
VNHRFDIGADAARSLTDVSAINGNPHKTALFLSDNSSSARYRLNKQSRLAIKFGSEGGVSAHGKERNDKEVKWLTLNAQILNPVRLNA